MLLAKQRQNKIYEIIRGQFTENLFENHFFMFLSIFIC